MDKINILPQSEEAIEKRKKRLYPALAAIALSGLVIGVGAKVHDAFASGELKIESNLTFSENNVETAAYDGEGIDNMIQRTMNGYEKHDIRDLRLHVESMPQNQEALSDGLQAGEILVIPESVEE